MIRSRRGSDDLNSTALTESTVIFREVKELRKKLERMEKLLKRDDKEEGKVRYELIDAK